MLLSQDKLPLQPPAATVSSCCGLLLHYAIVAVIAGQASSPASSCLVSSCCGLLLQYAIVAVISGQASSPASSCHCLQMLWSITALRYSCSHLRTCFLSSLRLPCLQLLWSITAGCYGCCHLRTSFLSSFTVSSCYGLLLQDIIAAVISVQASSPAAGVYYCRRLELLSSQDKLLLQPATALSPLLWSAEDYRCCHLREPFLPSLLLPLSPAAVVCRRL